MSELRDWLRRLFSKASGYQMGEDPSRRTKVLNALLISMITVSLLFTTINSIVFPVRNVAIVNAVSALLALMILLLFRFTGNYQMAAHMTVGAIMLCIIVYFHIVQNQHYAFVWICIVPPIAFYLLSKRSIWALMTPFGGYILYFLISGRGNWHPATFDGQSILSIIGATVCITGMLANLVNNRNDVLDELKAIGIKLENQQSDLRLILDSAAEAIYGIDLEGNCTFCNRRCIEILGYKEPSDLLGKNMHWQIHHSKVDGTAFPIDKCMILATLVKGEGSHIVDEVFWRADNTSLAVEYYSYPQIKNGRTVGAVVTFTDITDRKQRESEIEYLNCYDVLTGLHNRRCFEASKGQIDQPENLPISVIFADINGLKMTNDIFGHTAGDDLIKKSAEILRQACRQHDLVARVGGDEFIIILPKTSLENAQRIASRIRMGFSKAKVEAIKCSIALGLDTKVTADQPLDEVLANAENAMYKDKTMNRRTTNKDLIDTIIETLHSRSINEKVHANTVSDLCYKMGVAMHLPDTDIVKLQRAGYLHDIGKIVFDKSVLMKEKYSDDELEKMQQHSAIGYRILSLFDDTLDLAEYIYGHHEKWDGTGYPRGLQGEQIPLISRIIAVAETYDRILNRDSESGQGQGQHALEIIRERAGTQFDPAIAALFIKMMGDKGDLTS